MNLEGFKIGEFAVKISDLPDRIQNRPEWLKAQFDARGEQVRAQYDALLTALPGLVAEDISKAQFDSGSADMFKSVYDPQNKSKDIFAEIERVAAAVYTKAQADAKFATLEKCYPIGSIYMNTLATSPEMLFGGTWEKIEGRFLLGAGDGYTAGDTGGEAEHTLTEGEIPEHVHGVSVNYRSVYGTPGEPKEIIAEKVSVHGSGVTKIIEKEVGGGMAHNNMPPYVAVNIWRRIA